MSGSHVVALVDALEGAGITVWLQALCTAFCLPVPPEYRRPRDSYTAR